MCFSKATHSSFWSISTAAAVAAAVVAAVDAADAVAAVAVAAVAVDAAVAADNVDAAFNFKTPFEIPAILLLLFPRKKVYLSQVAD